ncbi:MAG: hypothetical protein SFU98_03235 [Leptospiraceae bacterium]|nr:hypothetical protein [Leptospiraceae bacterium]
MANNQGLNRNLILGGVAVLVLLIAVFYFLGPKSKSNVKSGKNADSGMSKTTDPTDNTKSGKDGTGVSGDTASEYGVTPEFLLEQYKEWAQYPPNSRPITNNNHDLVQPFFVMESPLELVDDPKDKEVNGYRCHFQPKTWAVIGPNAEMFIKLECRDKTNQPVPVKITDHKMFREDMDAKKYSALRADFNDDGRDGDEVAKDNIITFKWKPLKTDWGQMTLEADIAYGQGKKAKVTSTFFSSPNKPAEVTNVFRESTNDGSLIIHATVNVLKAGNYHLEANLKEAKEKNYIAYSTFDGSLKSGTNEVEFLFFGKILKDKGYDGPYIVTDVRGHRVNLAVDPAWFSQGEEGLKKIQAAKTTEPDKELVLPFTDEYKTKPYQISVFSNKEWASADKENRIKELQALSQK